MELHPELQKGERMMIVSLTRAARRRQRQE